MSLRSYLFALIGSLIVLLTITQLFLVYWIEQNLNKEVNVQARHISEQVLELAFKELDKDVGHRTNIKFISENISADGITIFTHDDFGNQQVIFKKSLQKNINDNLPKNVELAEIAKENSYINEVELHVVKKEFKTIVERIYRKNKRMEENEFITAHDVIVHPAQVFNSRLIKGLSPESKTKKLLNNIQWVLILCCIIALIAAYWLSAQFNKPLALLSAGFKKLANGDYQHHVAEQGIQEMRLTIQHFNNMVKRLDQLTKSAQQHNEIKHLAELGEVSRGLAHSLRNPIHTIGLSIEQLNDDELTPSYRDKLIKTIQNKIVHIDKNIKALLTLTTGGLSRNDSVPVLAVVQDIMLEYKSCHGKPQKFELEVSPDLSIIGAESEIRSILHTLIINACESNNEGIKNDNNENKTVIIKTTESDEHVCVTVVDQGCGLAKNIEESLFQPHISSKPEGAGMGLYIAKRIISLHYHGSISLNNEYLADGKISGCIAYAEFNKVMPTRQIRLTESKEIS
ncbi:MAG: HAMP domain-containing histidine kinase [Colwellia sp.]|nr:HAMP domain-containing histidine kinase [Colwellia sp.]